MWTGVEFCSYLDVSSIYRKNQNCHKREKIFSGYFLLDVVSCKSKKCYEMKIVRRDDDVSDSI